MSTTARPLMADDAIRFRQDLDTTPNLAFGHIARRAAPFVVHSEALAERLRLETGADIAVVPIVPHRVPSAPPSRRRGSGPLTVATFGEVSVAHKRNDLLVEMMAWLQQWNVDAQLVTVGACPPAERAQLDALAKDLGVGARLRYTGRCTSSEYEQWLTRADVAVQVRSSGVQSLSGATLECAAFGLPLVTTSSMARELGDVEFVGTVGNWFSSFDLADSVTKLSERFPDSTDTEDERQRFLARRTVDGYAARLAEILLEGVR
jgi:glycosyltransferase involved in cell wall biosynthesis